jgi:signal transduction histidine kinase
LKQKGAKVEQSATDELEQLKEQFNKLASLAGELAHEIKNPLAIIRMTSELLKEDFEAIDSKEARRALPRLESVISQCERLENILNDFLRFTRLSTLELKPGSLNKQVEFILDFIAPQAAKQNVEIIRHLDSQLPSIKLDPQTLQAALLNLVKNALEAMPEGGQLLARTRIIRTGVALDLIDNGCGMSPNTLINMFKDFYTNKEGGTGLGLPTAKKIIEAHGAKINVQSELGRGTQFTIEFPTLRRI